MSAPKLTDAQRGALIVVAYYEAIGELAPSKRCGTAANVHGLVRAGLCVVRGGEGVTGASVGLTDAGREALEKTGEEKGFAAYYAAIEADNAYSAELHRLFGKAAGDARYDARGESTPELRRLAAAKIAADTARAAASRDSRRS
jgi:hypothetical protein